MKLYYPVKPFIINQDFGVNGDYYQANGINIKGHNGLDLRATHGQPIHASHDGWANYEIDDKGGHGVVITTTGFKTIYWHMVDSGKEPQYRSPIENGPIMVKIGDVIGYADNTGLSTGDHCHFGLKQIDSAENTINTNNGYLGAIDPKPYLIGEYPEEQTQTTTYSFNIDLKLGDRSNDVKYLQSFLVDKGYLTPDCITGFYGPLTRKAVYQLQVNEQMPLGAQWLYLGFYFGPKTRTFLNNKYS